MTRPQYETASSLQVERESLAKFLLDSPYKAVKLPKRYYLDWVVMARDRSVNAWIECKRRYNMRSKYPTFMMSMKKWQEGSDLSRLGGKPFYVVVEWDDGLFYVRQDEVLDAVTYGIGGRTDRNDPEDIEPCVYIPVHLFQPRVRPAPATEPKLAAGAS